MLTDRSSGGFVGNILKLASGSTFAQGLGFLIAPVIARLFTPEAFGVAGIFVSMSSIISGMACLRYNLSIMLPENDDEAAALFWVSVCSTIVVSSIAGLVVLLGSEFLSRVFKCPPLKGYLWLAPLAVLTNGFVLSLASWNSRMKRFGCLSIIPVFSSVKNHGGKFALGISGYTTGGVLIFTGIFGRVVALLYLGIFTLRGDCRVLKANFCFANIVAGVKRHKKFAIFSTWGILLNNVSRQIPVWILGVFFTPSIVGFYALISAVVSVPVSLLGDSVMQVFYQKASEMHNRQQNFSDVVEAVVKGMVLICTFPSLLIMLVGNDIVGVVFGSQWLEAGVYLQILSPWLLFLLIYSPITTLFNVFEKQDSFVLFNLLRVLVSCLVLWIAALSGKVMLVVGCFSGINILMIGLSSFWILRKGGVPTNK